MIDLLPDDLARVRSILARHVPSVEVRAFGSRVTGRAKPWSDLDLVLVADGPLPAGTLAALREAFAESDLGIRVDVVEWTRLSDGLRDAVQHAFEVVQIGTGLPV